MGNSSSKSINNQYVDVSRKPNERELNESVNTLRAYHANTNNNDPWKHVIGKFLNEVDQLIQNNMKSNIERQKNITPSYKKKKKSKSLNNDKKNRFNRQAVKKYNNSYNSSSKRSSAPSLEVWLRNQQIYDANIAYMLRLQNIKHPTIDFKTYTQSQFDELETFCKKQRKHREKQEQLFIEQKLKKIQIYWKKQILTEKRKKKRIKNITKRRKKQKGKKTPDIPPSKSSPSKPGENNNNLLSAEQKMFSYKEMLVHGYIRDLSEILLPNIIIPIDICHLCLKYFSHNEVFIIHLPIQRAVPLCIKVRNDYYTQHTMNIFELNSKIKQDSTRFVDDKWRIQESSLTFKQNVKLPPIITKKLNDAYNRHYGANYYKYSETDTYSIIFNRGGGHANLNGAIWNKKCYAISFNDRELYKNDTSQIIGFKYSLPTLKRELSELLYSDRYGLIAVGGGISIYNLSFRNEHFYNQNKNEWKWLSFGHLQQRRKQFSTIMLDAKRLMVVGGDKVNDPKSELIDLSGHRNKRTIVTDCNGIRFKCGIMYDNYNKRVFVAGGVQNGADNTYYSVYPTVDEFYDVVKDKWCIYAKAVNNQYKNRNMYKNRPTLYSVDMETIYKTDGKGNIACIDLRDNDQKWKQYEPNIKMNLVNRDGYRVVI